MTQGRGNASQVTSKTVWTIGLNVVAMALILLFIYFTRDIFFLLLAALLLTGALNPVIVWLQKRGIKRNLAILGFFAVAMIAAGLFVFSFIPIFEDQFGKLVTSYPQYLERLQHNSLFEWANEKYNIMELVQKHLTQYGADIGMIFFGVLTGLFKGVFAIITILVLTIFMLVFGKEILQGGIDLLDPSRRSRYVDLAQMMQKTVGGYVIGTLFIASIGGVVITITLLILGVPYFLPLGLMMIVFGLIPYIGPIIAAVIIVGTTLATTGVTAGIVSAAVFLVYQQVENHLLQPLIQRRTIQMNPLIVVVVMLLGTSLAGIVGAILALPVAGAIQVVIHSFLGTEAVDAH